MIGCTSTLRILATTDLHMQLTGWDDNNDKPVPDAGLSRLASRVEEARSTAEGACLLFDNGDAVQGGPISDVLGNEPVEPDHPWPNSVAAMRYDALGLGNHDFDYGLEYLTSLSKRHTCPVIASTVRFPAEGLKELAILRRHTRCSDGKYRLLRVGLMSTLPVQTALWCGNRLGPIIRFEEPVAAVRRLLPDLQQAGADIIVLLAHTGIADADDPENTALSLARIPGIDAMVTGHTHQAFPCERQSSMNGIEGVDCRAGTLAGVPAVMPGHNASSLGQIDLSLEYGSDGWRVVGHSCRLLPAKGALEAPAITRAAKPAREMTRRALSNPIAETDKFFHSYFGLLAPTDCQAVVAQAMTRSVAREVSGTDLENLPILASVAPSACGGRGGPGNYTCIEPGPITMRHVSMLCPFQNDISAAVLTGAALTEWIERSLVLFHSPVGSMDVEPLIDREAPKFNFDTVFGLDVLIDPTPPARYDPQGRRTRENTNRARSLQWNGKPIDRDQEFLVAMTSYRASGGGRFPGLGPNLRYVQTGRRVSAAVIDVLRSGFPELAPVQRPWRFAPDLGIEVTYDTAPEAIDHLHEISHLHPRSLGLTPDGFLRLRLTL